ncbi:MAG: helix-turn-helix domain-containing protein [Patescibacteria group bacterium]
MTLEQVLKEQGLRERHIKVYLACLELGSGSIQTISRKAGVPRSTGSIVLEALRQKGFVSAYKKKTIIHYNVEDPKKILAQIKQKAKIFEESLPEFSAFYGKNKILPNARLYEGKEGMKLVLNEVLSDRTDICTFTSASDLFKLLGEDFRNYIKKRVELGIRTRVIAPDSPDARDQLRTGVQELRDVRIIPNTFEHSTHIWVWGHKIAMLSTKLLSWK